MGARDGVERIEGVDSPLTGGLSEAVWRVANGIGPPAGGTERGDLTFLGEKSKTERGTRGPRAEL